ncbi:hypothetical protein C0J52_18252 [Blattella germanica]|nr:hypothetical protein C0J52_18252 [Blattella germanica]
MKLDQEAIIAVAAVTILLLSCTVPNVEVMAIATNSPYEVQQADSSLYRVRRQSQKTNSNRGFFGLIYDFFTEGIQLNTTDPDLARELPDNATETTTAASYLLTQDEVYRLFRRNIRGLARLFNQESRKAIQVALS